MQQYLFPFETIRQEQNKLISDVESALKNKQHIIINAPTGLGKTVSTIGPALKYAIDNDLTVFFLTPKHTQHKIAIDTLREIRKKFNLDIQGVDFIGKKNMCSVQGVENLPSGQFAVYCQNQIGEGKCEFYKNTKKNEGVLQVKADKIVKDLMNSEPKHTEELVNLAKQERMCGYEIAAEVSKKAKLIVADYYHLLHPSIRENFLRRTNNDLSKSIIIIDEAHNLPGRSRDLTSSSLSTFIINAAINEAKKSDFNETVQNLTAIKEVLHSIYNSGTEKEKDEAMIKKETFYDLIKLKTNTDVQQLIADFEFIADEIREEKKQSFIGSVANFLQEWNGGEFGYVRIVKRDEKKSNDGEQRWILSYSCLDPSLVTQELIEKSYCTIAMSGTLSPVEMYRDLLGFSIDRTIMKSYNSPFKQENRLNLIIPETTTKYSDRSVAQFKRIAEICANIINIVPGNSAVFFPSYQLRNDVYTYFSPLCKKTTFLEEQGMTKEEKSVFLEKYKDYKDSGAVLLGAVSGSFSEGIDLPGDFLKCVVIVGVPLNVPDLETKKLIDYYDAKYGKGWDYGYSLPAMTKCLQGAGRCIRSETDRGVIVFLDKRFSWGSYYKCFPKDWEIKMTALYEERVKEFFGIL